MICDRPRPPLLVVDKKKHLFALLYVGYYKQEGIPERTLETDTCAVCGNKLLVSADQEGVIENTYRQRSGSALIPIGLYPTKKFRPKNLLLLYGTGAVSMFFRLSKNKI